MQNLQRMQEMQKCRKRKKVTKYARRKICQDCLESTKKQDSHDWQVAIIKEIVNFAENAINLTMQRIRQMEGRQRD